jgi:excisionase family DNA binding protein
MTGTALSELALLCASFPNLEERVIQHFSVPNDSPFYKYPFEVTIRDLLVRIDLDLVDKDEVFATRSRILLRKSVDSLNSIVKELRKEISEEPKVSVWKGWGHPLSAKELEVEIYLAARESIKVIQKYLDNLVAESIDQKIDGIESTRSTAVPDSMNELTQLDGLLITEDVCRILKVNKRTVQNYRNDGKIKFTKTGRIIYYRREDIEDYLSSHDHKSR